MKSVSTKDNSRILFRQPTYVIDLAGVDAPELDQPGGQTARQSLSDGILNKGVSVYLPTEHPAKHTSGYVVAEWTINVNFWMVNGGHAWHDVVSAKDNTLLADAEKKARQAKCGLWAADSPIPPWEWRRKNEPQPQNRKNQ